MSKLGLLRTASVSVSELRGHHITDNIYHNLNLSQVISGLKVGLLLNIIKKIESAQVG